MGGRVKIVSRKPASAVRCVLQLEAPVAFDGKIVEAGELVEVSDMQVVELIMHGRAMKAWGTKGQPLVVRPRAVMEWPDDTMTPRQRRKWRPRRVGANRVAPRGSVRLDPGASIFEQVRGFMG